MASGAEHSEWALEALRVARVNERRSPKPRVRAHQSGQQPGAMRGVDLVDRGAWMSGLVALSRERPGMQESVGGRRRC